jgi:predicted porin
VSALAALAATGAFAQSSVTLYGVADIAYGAHKTKGTGTNSIKSSGVMDGANAGSRIGFRGTEDLGGGLSAQFVVEQGIAPTNDELFGTRSAAGGHQVDGFSAGGGAAAVSGSAGAYSNGTNRQSYLGLSSKDLGTLRIGYQYTNVYELSSLAGYTLGSEGVPGADKAHLHMNAQAGGTRANAITYISPSFSGLRRSRCCVRCWLRRVGSCGSWRRRGWPRSRVLSQCRQTTSQSRRRSSGRSQRPSETALQRGADLARCNGMNRRA